MKFQTDQFYFKSAVEMAQVFGEIPEALSRTMDIASRCNVKVERIANPFPEFKVPEGIIRRAILNRWCVRGLPRASQLERQRSWLSANHCRDERRLTSESK